MAFASQNINAILPLSINSIAVDFLYISKGPTLKCVAVKKNSIGICVMFGHKVTILCFGFIRKIR